MGINIVKELASFGGPKELQMESRIPMLKSFHH